MPKQKTFAQMQRDCRTFTELLKLAEKKIAYNNARGLRKGLLGTTRVAAPALRLNVGKRGTRIGVRLDPYGTASYRVKATGPYQLIERDTDAHTEPRKRFGSETGRLNKKTGKRAVRRKRGPTLLIPGIGYRQFAAHPGTTGKHPWTRGIAAYTPQLLTVAGKQIHADLEGAFT
jgi:hypothetical protein